MSLYFYKLTGLYDGPRAYVIDRPCNSAESVRHTAVCLRLVQASQLPSVQDAVEIDEEEFRTLTAGLPAHRVRRAGEF